MVEVKHYDVAMSRCLDVCPITTIAQMSLANIGIFYFAQTLNRF